MENTNTAASQLDNRVADMKRRLQMHGNGAYAHTANKARCYLSKFPDSLLPLCEAALSSGEWKQLAFAMRKLW